jgi:hypothetical protein
MNTDDPDIVFYKPFDTINMQWDIDWLIHNKGRHTHPNCEDWHCGCESYSIKKRVELRKKFKDSIKTN